MQRPASTVHAHRRPHEDVRPGAMARCLLFTIVLLAATTRVLASEPAAAPANLLVSTVPGEQQSPQVVPDGEGGALIAWQQVSADEPGRIFVQHVTAGLRLDWGAAGLPVSGPGQGHAAPVLAADSSGGAIIAWQERRSGSGWDIYAQRIDRAGRLLWRDGGVRVSCARGDQVLPAIAADGHGGALIAWQDERSDAEPDLYVQALDADGRPRWSLDGTAVLSAPGAQRVVRLLADGTGGWTVVWTDTSPGASLTDVRAQRLDASGNPEWTPAGVWIADDVTVEPHPVAIRAPDGSLLVAWQAAGVRAQSLDPAGHARWGIEGISLSAPDGGAPAIVADGAGGAIVAWQSAALDGDAADIRAQAIRASGSPRWPDGGAVVCRAAGPRAELAEVAGADGSAIVAWRDASDARRGDLFAQRVDSTGTVAWRRDGVALSDETGFDDALEAASDGRGGLIAVWSDGWLEHHLHAQRVESSGTFAGESGQPVAVREGMPPAWWRSGSPRGDHAGRQSARIDIAGAGNTEL